MNHGQGVDEIFIQGFGVIPANGIKIFTKSGLGNDVSQIREGETVAASDFMPTFWGVFQPCSIDPGNGSRHHRKIDVIDHGMGITGLTFAAANVLFDLLETGFDFPPCTIVLDYLFNGQIQVGGKESNPLCFTKDPDHPDRAFKRLEHDQFCGNQHIAVMSIEKHAMA